MGTRPADRCLEVLGSSAMGPGLQCCKIVAAFLKIFITLPFRVVNKKMNFLYNSVSINPLTTTALKLRDILKG